MQRSSCNCADAAVADRGSTSLGAGPPNDVLHERKQNIFLPSNELSGHQCSCAPPRTGRTLMAPCLVRPSNVQ